MEPLKVFTVKLDGGCGTPLYLLGNKEALNQLTDRSAGCARFFFHIY
jgi:hypothetical protein